MSTYRKYFWCQMWLHQNSTWQLVAILKTAFCNILGMDWNISAKFWRHVCIGVQKVPIVLIIIFPHQMTVSRLLFEISSESLHVVMSLFCTIWSWISANVNEVSVYTKLQSVYDLVSLSLDRPFKLLRCNGTLLCCALIMMLVFSASHHSEMI